MQELRTYSLIKRKCLCNHNRHGLSINSLPRANSPKHSNGRIRSLLSMSTYKSPSNNRQLIRIHHLRFLSDNRSKSLGKPTFRSSRISMFLNRNLNVKCNTSSRSHSLSLNTNQLTRRIHITFRVSSRL